jgi:hypothetical protein
MLLVLGSVHSLARGQIEPLLTDHNYGRRIGMPITEVKRIAERSVVWKHKVAKAMVPCNDTHGGLREVDHFNFP